MSTQIVQFTCRPLLNIGAIFQQKHNQKTEVTGLFFCVCIHVRFNYAAKKKQMQMSFADEAMHVSK